MVLIIIEELMRKSSNEFLEHFARLGVFSKVQALIITDQSSDPQPPTSNNSTINATLLPTSINDSIPQNVTSTTQQQPYQIQTTGNNLFYYYMRYIRTKNEQCLFYFYFRLLLR